MAAADSAWFTKSCGPVLQNAKLYLIIFLFRETFGASISARKADGHVLQGGSTPEGSSWP